MLKNSPYKRGNEILPYRPAQLCDGKEWYIWYYAATAETKLTGKLKRARIKLNYIKNKRTRRRYAEDLIEQINSDLRKGWSPFLTDKGGNNILLLSECFTQFERKKIRELEHDSQRTYVSQIKMLQEWLEMEELQNIRAIDFTRRHAINYLDFVSDVKKVAPRTWNNYNRTLSAIFNWMFENELISQNPFAKIRKVRVIGKNRVPIPLPLLREIHEYFEINAPEMLLCCYLLFYTELRPTEQTKLLVRDINLDAQIIRMDAEITKNKKARFPTIPDVFAEYLQKLPWKDYDPKHYLISATWKPGPKKLQPRYISNKWDDMRQELNLPLKYKFYSLRDTGIEFMLDNGILSHDVMKQAGHSDLAMTTEYANHHAPVANKEIKKMPDGF